MMKGLKCSGEKRLICIENLKKRERENDYYFYILIITIKYSFEGSLLFCLFLFRKNEDVYVSY